MTPEFSHRVPVDQIGSAPHSHHIAANEAERAALAARFALAGLVGLEADIALSREAAGIRARGRVAARLAQACVVSGQPVAQSLDEAVDVLFTADAGKGGEGDEFELDAADCDILPLEGDAVDLGELAAETMGLALDPYPRLGDAELAEYRRLLTSEEDAAAAEQAARDAANPFAVLKRK